ncbi:DUF397 domain-containing protein [Streptomyces melanogenes]|uniref:DUF397 domain-containing protein n=1 Tax=Streptomyces melanogenes TaxID=67326 RepID=A0ABZ1XMF1_9ACTN|nr:DUF397 domain-containing protein [Streptomyces melanogenes]
MNWFKSSYSSGEGGECVEVAYDWRKSSYSDGEGGACVEIASHPSAIHIRDSKRNTTGGPEITVLPSAWAEFVSYATR